MKTIDIHEMIKVMQHFADGGMVESRQFDRGHPYAPWSHTDSPGWQWNLNDYRIEQTSLSATHNSTGEA